MLKIRLFLYFSMGVCSLLKFVQEKWLTTTSTGQQPWLGFYHVVQIYPSFASLCLEWEKMNARATWIREKYPDNSGEAKCFYMNGVIIVLIFSISSFCISLVAIAHEWVEYLFSWSEPQIKIKEAEDHMWVQIMI